MNPLIPLQLNEAGNGALFVMLLFGVAYMGKFVGDRIIEWYGWHGMTNRAKFATHTNKAAIGILTMFVGFAIKSGASWWALHVINDGGKAPAIVLTPLFVVGTLIGLWGVVCTIRALTPYEWRRYTWLWLTGGAIAFGVAFAW